LPDGLVDTFLSIVGEFGEASTLVSARAQPTSPKVDCSGKRRMAGLLENLRFLNLIFVGAGGGGRAGGRVTPSPKLYHMHMYVLLAYSAANFELLSG
jgi:hypothetical protein